MYLLDTPRTEYQEFLEGLEEELTYTFGGCSVIRRVDGFYLARIGQIMRDRVNLLHVDSNMRFERNLIEIAQYADYLRQAAFDALKEEVVLVVVLKVHHCV